MAAGVSPGDSVLTVPNTFIATTEAISQAGAQPEFVDVDERTYNMDPEKLRAYLETKCDQDQVTGRPISRRTGRTISAVVPVHLYGQTADMDPILDLADTYNLVVVEDACQAHGAEYFSRKADAGKRLDPWGKQQPSVSILARILALVVRLAQSRPTTQTWRKEYACCATMAKQRSTTTT